MSPILLYFRIDLEYVFEQHYAPIICLTERERSRKGMVYT